MYEQLVKLYYKDSNKYHSEYEKRINSFGTVRLPFNIKPFKCNEEYSCFYVNHSELDFLHDLIIKQSKIINSSVLKLPKIAVKQYFVAKLIDELLSTNEIEGVRSTKAEMETVVEIVIRKGKFKKNKARHLSLMNSYFNLISETKSTLQNIKQIREIYDNLVLEEIKKDDQPDGCLFRKQSADVVSSTGKVIHRGVYPEDSIKAYLTNLIDYLNNHNSPMLYKIAIAHYFFGYIHPFYDGNGRTSRYISSMYLISELDQLTALTLSYSTNKTKQLYYDAFSDCNNPYNKGELTFFCEVFFQIIHKAQSDILAELSQKQEKMKQLKLLVKQHETTNKLSNTILYILGQNYIFGVEGRGMTQKELLSNTKKTEYFLRKALEDLKSKGLIQYLKRKPIEVTLSEVLCEELI